MGKKGYGSCFGEDYQQYTKHIIKYVDNHFNNDKNIKILIPNALDGLHILCTARRGFKLDCYEQQKSKPRYIKDPNCKNKRWDTFEIEDVVLEELFKMSLDIDLFKKTFNIATVNVKNELKIRLEEIKKQINNLLNFIASGIAVEETNNKITELEKEKEMIEEKLISSDQKEKDNKVSLNMITNLKTTWFDMDFDEQRRIIEHLIDKVVVKDNEVSIYYNIY